MSNARRWATSTKYWKAKHAESLFQIEPFLHLEAVILSEAKNLLFPNPLRMTALLSALPCQQNLSRRDRLPHMTLRVIGHMHQQSANTRRQLLLSHSARLIKITSRQSTHTLRRQFQSLVEFHKERFPARAWVHLALQRRNLVIGKLMTFCVSQQPVKASRNVPQMKRNRREVKRSRMQVSLAQRFAPAVYIFQCQFESVQNSARYGWYFCQCSTQPGFRLLRWRYSTLSITHSVKDLSSVEIHARLPPDRDALRRLLHSWRACRLLLLYLEAR